MTVYILIFCLVTFFALCEISASTRYGDRGYKHIHIFFFFIISLGFFLIAGFRECGFDYINYWRYYQDLHSPQWLSRGMAIGAEPGYSLLNYLAGSYKTVIIVMSAAILCVQFVFIYKYSRLPILAVVFYLGLFMYFSTMGQFRQALAMSITLWAILNKKNKTAFFLLIALAMMFHFSAIIGVLVLFVPEQLKTTKFYVWVFIGALVCGMTAQTLYLNLIPGLPPYVANKLAHYAATETSPLGLNTAVLIRAFIFFLCYHYREKLSHIRAMPYMINVYFLSLIIYTALGFAPQVAGRGSIYFSFFEIVLTSNLLYVVKGKKGILLLGIFILFSLYRQINFLQSWQDDYIPYKNWMFNNTVI